MLFSHYISFQLVKTPLCPLAPSIIECPDNFVPLMLSLSVIRTSDYSMKSANLMTTLTNDSVIVKLFAKDCFNYGSVRVSSSSLSVCGVVLPCCLATGGGINWCLSASLSARRDVSRVCPPDRGECFPSR